MYYFTKVLCIVSGNIGYAVDFKTHKFIYKVVNISIDLYYAWFGLSQYALLFT